METNTEAHKWTVCREWETLGCSVIIKASPLVPSRPHAACPPSGIYAEEGQEEWETQSWWRTLRKGCLPDTTGLTHIQTHTDCGSMHKAWTYSSQMGPQYWVGSGHVLPPLTRSISSRCPRAKGKSVFSNGASSGVLTTRGAGQDSEVIL